MTSPAEAAPAKQAATPPAAITAPAPAARPSQPTSVLFYPDEVQVTVEETLKPQPLPGGGLGFILTLPAGSARDTFSVTVAGASVPGTYWQDDEDRPTGFFGGFSGNIVLPPSRNTLVPAEEPLPERRALLQLRVNLKDEQAKIQGNLDAIKWRMRLWTAPLSANGGPPETEDEPATQSGPKPEKLMSPEERAKFDASLERILPALSSMKEKEERAMQDVTARLEKAEEALQEFDQLRDYQVAVVPWSGTAGETAAVRYSYIMPAACSTSYRVGAFPGKGSLTIEQDAALYQNSGSTWEAPEVFVSTTRRDRTLSPGYTRPWQLRLYDKAAAGAAGFARKAEAPEPMADLKAQVAVNQESLERSRVAPVPPQQEEKSTFRLWSLGKHRIAQNAQVRVPLSSDSYKADYIYTLRPAANAKGFLTADISLPVALELPQGEAQFFVDGVAMGASPFSFNGDKATIYFGSDPQVTATMRDVKLSTGEQGFISKEQTTLWHWTITLKNTRKHPVKVRVEDAAPDATDTAIKVTVQSTPKPEEVINAPQFGGAKIYRWETTLNPGEPQVIDHKVEVAAPTEKTLSPGRGSR